MKYKDLVANTSLSKPGKPLRRSKYQIFPPHTLHRHEALEQSILGHGIETATTWDDDGNLLDGWERESICETQGLRSPREVRHFDTEADKFQFILAVNAHRRPNLSQKQKQAVIETYLLGDPEIADKTLADALGVSKNTVLKVRVRLEATRKIKTVSKTRGKDGKLRPVKYAKCVITNTPKEFEKALEIVKDLPESCVGKTVDIITASRRARHEHNPLNFYPTPKPVTLALLQRECFEGTIWEPACGTGDMAELLVKHLPNPVFASDLNNTGYGNNGIDFLTSTKKVENILTNPPFEWAMQFKKQALQLAQKKVSLLMYCKQLGPEVESRSPLKSVYVFDKPIFKNIGWLMAWYVWEIGYNGPISVERIGR